MAKIDGRTLDHKALEHIRILAVRRVVEDGEAPSVVMESLGFSRTAIYPWLRKFEQEGWDALVNHSGPKCAAVRCGNFQSACTVNDVAVREHVPVGRDYKTRARAAGFRSALLPAVGMMHANIYHGWANLLDDATDRPRIGVEQFPIVLC